MPEGSKERGSILGGVVKSLPNGEMGNILILNVLYSFIAAALGVIIPLYMLHLKIDVSYIGLIISLGPLVFLILRVFFASFADEIGTRMINILSSVSNLGAIAVYALLATPLGFAFGSFLEGIRMSAFWAVVRTDILFVNGHVHASKTLAHFSGLRQLGDGLGRFLIGFAIVVFAFQGSFLLISVLSIIMLVLTLKIGHGGSNGRKVGPDKGLRAGMFSRIAKKRPLSFWQASILLMLIFVVINTLSSFLIPVYFTAGLNLSYEETGIFLALFSLFTAVATLLSIKYDIHTGILLFLAFLMVPGLIMMPFMGRNILIPAILLALGSAACNILNEYVIVDQVLRSRDVSTDIGVLYVPLKLVEFSFLAVGGFVIARYGYVPLFAVQALFVIAFVISMALASKRSAG